MQIVTDRLQPRLLVSLDSGPQYLVRRAIRQWLINNDFKHNKKTDDERKICWKTKNSQSKKQMKRERLAERLKTVKQEDNLSPILSTALTNL